MKTRGTMESSGRFLFLIPKLRKREPTTGSAMVSSILIRETAYIFLAIAYGTPVRLFLVLRKLAIRFLLPVLNLHLCKVFPSRSTTFSKGTHRYFSAIRQTVQAVRSVQGFW